MTVAGSVIADLIARTGSFDNDILKSARNLNSQAARMNRSLQSIDAQVKRTATGFSNLVKAGLALAGVNLGADMLRDFAQITDTVRRTNGQIALATQGYGEFGRAQEAARRAAQDYGKSYEDVGRLLANVTRAAHDMGRGVGDAEGITRSVLAAVKASGAGAQEASAGILQFSQALRSGKLQGDELRSIMENLPALAEAIAKGMGVTAGALRQMGADGELSAQKVVDALLKMQSELERNAATIEPTFADAWQRFSNLAVEAVSDFDRGGQFSRMIIDWANESSAKFDDVGRAAEDMGIKVRAALDTATEAFSPLLSVIDNVIWAVREMDAGMRRLQSIYPANLLQLTNPVGMAGVIRDQFSGSYEANVAARRRDAAEANFRRFTADFDLLGNPIGGARAAGGGGGEDGLSAKAKRALEKQAREARKAAEEAARLKAEYAAITAELTGQLNVLQLRNAHFTDEANRLEDQLALERELTQIREQFKGLDPALLRDMEDLAKRTITLTQETERFQEKLRELDGLKIEIDVDFAAEMGREIEEAVARLPDLRTNMQRFWDELEEMGPHAFDAISLGIEDVILGFRSMGDAIRNVVAELASMAMQAFIFEPLRAAIFPSGGGGGLFASLFGGGGGGLSGLPSADSLFSQISVGGIGAGGSFPGFATGTDFAPGGLAWVGERGRELVNLPRGSQVVPHMRSEGLMRALRSMEAQANRPARARPGNVIFNVSTPDANSFRASERQLSRRARRTMLAGA